MGLITRDFIDFFSCLCYNIVGIGKAGISLIRTHTKRSSIVKIIVVQQSQGLVSLIKELVSKIDPNRAENIFFTNIFNEATHEIDKSKDNPLLIISNNKTDGAFVDFRLAEYAKSINPSNLFLLYSIRPQKNEYVDGFIPKPQGDDNLQPSLLTKILTSDILAGDLDKIVLQRLKRDFPKITFFSSKI